MFRDSRRAGMLLLLLASPVLAQFADLATTDDGSQLYFTSTMQLRDADRSARQQARLYRYSLGRVSLYAERSAIAPERPIGGFSHVSLSGDGSVLGFTVQESGEERIEVRGRSLLDLGPGAVQISRNGRWALTYSEHEFCEGMWCQITHTTTLVNLTDGRRTVDPVSTTRGHARILSLTSEGGIFGEQPSDKLGIGGVPVPIFGVWKDSRFTPVPLPSGRTFYPVAISDDGRNVIVSEFGEAMRTRLLTVSTATGAMTIIAESSEAASPYLLSLSNDGRRVLYTMLGNDAPAYIWDATTGRSIRVPFDPGESATDGVLSGDGRIAYIATTRARIVRFTIDVNVAAPIFPPPPYCDDPGWIALGSLARFHCSFAEGGILLGSTVAPVVASNAGEIDIQIPWESEQDGRLSYDVPTDSPFRGTQAVRSEQGAPEILPDSRGLFGMRAARGDWSGPLTSLPSAGDIFHIYMTGLGPVQVGQTTGVPAPIDQPVPIAWRLDCSLLPRRQPVETLFAGLAPGLLGVYQTTFRMPTIPMRGMQPDGFECMLVSDTMAVSFRPGSPRQPICGGACAIVSGPVQPR